MAEPLPVPPRRSVFQMVWISALVLVGIAAVIFPLDAPPKRIAGAPPGQGPGPVFPKGWEERRKVFAETKEADMGAIVFAGDSITHGWTTLAEAFPGVKVANRGIAGDTSRGLLTRFEADVLALKPRGIVILIGTNDLARGASPEVVALNVRDMIHLAHKEDPALPVVLCLAMPRKPESGKFPDLLLELNARLRAISTTLRAVTHCETWEPFANEIGAPRPGEFPDGLHPGPSGYAKWAEALRPALKAANLID